LWMHHPRLCRHKINITAWIQLFFWIFYIASTSNSCNNQQRILWQLWHILREMIRSPCSNHARWPNLIQQIIRNHPPDLRTSGLALISLILLISLLDVSGAIIPYWHQYFLVVLLILTPLVNGNVIWWRYHMVSTATSMRQDQGWASSGYLQLLRSKELRSEYKIFVSCW
jgi:hypothetical protein